MAVILAAISMSAARVELWFLGDLLGIAPLFVFRFSVSSVVVVLLSGASCSGKVFAELIVFRSLLPLMYVLPSGASTT